MLRLIRADNPSPMTLDGTNSYLLFSADGSSALLLDPGPDLEEHQAALLGALREAGARLAAIVLSHFHADHSEMLHDVDEWAPGVPVYAVREEFRRLTGELAQGQEIPFGPGPGDSARVHLTPGHTRDSICLTWDDTLFTGDTVLGRGTTIVTHPEGTLRGYLHSLEHLRTVVASGEASRIAPAHGPGIDEPLRVLEEYQRHRQERLSQVRAALAAGASDADEVVDAVYADVAPELRGAAKQSVQAQLDYLREE